MQGANLRALSLCTNAFLAIVVAADILIGTKLVAEFWSGGWGAIRGWVLHLSAEGRGAGYSSESLEHEAWRNFTSLVGLLACLTAIAILVEIRIRRTRRRIP